jgi:hypothetical protein
MFSMLIWTVTKFLSYLGTILRLLEELFHKTSTSVSLSLPNFIQIKKAKNLKLKAYLYFSVLAND